MFDAIVADEWGLTASVSWTKIIFIRDKKAE
jgi:hypothetical protein